MTATAITPDDVQTTTLAALPAVGAPFLGGIFAGVTTNGGKHHCAVVLLLDWPAPTHWQAAMDWAKSVGGELPSRAVSALLFANLRDKFLPRSSHWTSEPDGSYGSCAWVTNFLDGRQYSYHTGDEVRALAVRLIPLTA
jgi:hypothetical protein